MPMDQTSMMILYVFFLFITLASICNAQRLTGQHLIVGTFNTEELIVLHFQPENSNLFQIEHVWNAVGNHSWLSLNAKQQTLIATSWTSTPAIASYQVSVDEEYEIIQLRNFEQFHHLSTYVSFNPILTQSNGKVYSVGGKVGEVLSVDLNTSLIQGTVQRMEYEKGQTRKPKTGKYFKQLHNPIQYDPDAPNTYENEKRVQDGVQCSIVSPDGSLLFVADTGENCVWVQGLDKQTGLIINTEKVLMPRENDRPTRVWPHPNGKYLYVLQRDTNIVDVFEIQPTNPKTPLKWVQGALTIPNSKNVERFMGQEVRTIVSSDERMNGNPEYLVVSTSGKVLADVSDGNLNPKGFVTLFKLTKEGLLDPVGHHKEHVKNQDGSMFPIFFEPWVANYETATSGGFSNELIPSAKILHKPKPSIASPDLINKGQYMILTETTRGLVTMLAIEYDKHDKPRINQISQLPLASTWRGIQRLPSMAIWL